MKTFLNTLALIFFPLFLFGQQVTNADFISPLEDGFASVKIQNQWGFMDKNGKLVLNLRDDLISNEQITTATDLGVASMAYPLMIEERAIVKVINEGISYYGFINSQGHVVIKQEFLNVSNFKDGYAIALKLSEEVLGQNQPLGKRIVNYYYDLVLINPDGQIYKYLSGPFPVVLAKEKLQVAPPIIAKDIGFHLIAVKTPNGKWEVIYVN